MISYALKAAWFALSLSGLLSSLVALRYSVVALGGHWIPVSYAIANTTMQTTFCLGMIWKMNPYAMPSGFCRLQAALVTLSWFAMTGLCAIMSVSTSLTIVRARGKVTMAEFQRSLEWRPVYMPILCGSLAVFFTIFLVVSLKLHALEGSDGLQCDVAGPAWIRLLGYAGIPLLFAIPSLVLACASMFLLWSSRQGSANPPADREAPRAADAFTTAPIRRSFSTKRFSARTFEPDTPIEPEPETPASAVFDADVREASRSVSATPSGEPMIYIVPSRTPSDHARHSVGRAPISPVVARHSRHYHLPFSWKSGSTLSVGKLSADARPSRSPRSPSPMSFLPHMSSSSARTSPESLHVCPTLMYGQPTSSTFLMDLGDGSADGHAQRQSGVFWDEATGAFVYDGEDDGEDADADTASGSMRWARPSDASDSTKSPELEFASPAPGEGAMMYTYPKRPPSSDAAASTPAWRNADVWRTLFFETFLSVAQIVGAVTSLADVFSARGAPTPFGSQHVAFLFFAWAPTIAFGVLPWRRLMSLVH
ncbi:uncharacterized protein C8Q71DRAFT_858895 [Rhodofomes roseus]|uniref:G-protein coupled receptors family 2 profile 2 domain-containing protein n=1 Tax=Rhodofomes roseus TaxID=34475 RepID=A0ABQ8KCB9_9APHY|nr:uncharacterized protein C8Q71DRAFT_858895 [Rhodofomes roseus]KAH9835245.1 hypothetical protein C8Q71DRAFT_858895 [Rhodofomes roseus]